MDQVTSRCPEHATARGSSGGDEASTPDLSQGVSVFALNCPLGGEYNVGTNWAETH